MNHYQELIDTYRQADEDHRLSLYLCHPVLRETFMRIDLLARRSEAAAAQSRPKRLSAMLRRHLARYCLGF